MMARGIVILAMLLQVNSAASAVITHCGESDGMSFNFESALVPADKAGLHPDRVAGNFELIAGDNYSDPDITYNGALGRGSYKSDGAHVTVLPGGPPGFILVIAIGPAAEVDHYLFKLDNQGKGTVAWGSTRAGDVDQHITLMTASCDGGSR